MSTKQEYTEKIEIPEKVEVELVGSILKVKGEKGISERDLLSPKIKIKKEGNFIILSTDKFTRNEKVLLNTTRAHIKNLLRGVSEVYIYKLKICSSHFPITASVEGDKVLVKNFIGEKIPRESNIIKGAVVDVKGDIITVTSPSKEAAGQTAANIEQATRITNRDRRVFQDGCYIFIKSGEPIQ